MHNGSIFLTRGYGVSDLDSGSPVTNETLFYVASTGKAMTSMMLAELMAEDDEEGEGPGVTLDTPIQELVGDVFQVQEISKICVLYSVLFFFSEFFICVLFMLLSFIMRCIKPKR